ncbi:MAG: endolytic transglycosylase MltG [Bacteroidetes bacterium]|nr:endolytic transglycosylase MltG [Bacteroidota bacterium]
MKKLISFIFIIVLVYEVYTLFIKSTSFTETQVSFKYDKGTMSINDLGDSLVTHHIIREKYSFTLLAPLFDIEHKTKSGQFLVKKNSNLFSIFRMLRNNQQPIVKFILNKVRTRAELSKLVATTFTTDSAQAALFFNSNDSLAPFNIDTTQLLTLFIPNTYEFYWSTSIPKLLVKMKEAQSQFWLQQNRSQKAERNGMTSQQVYTLASIVEEETNKDSDKILIASVYQNRLKKNMPLQACPTIKYAMQDFTLTRIYEKYLTNPSPYNTYKNTGLPPGPICTPSPNTIDLVLNAPNTEYFYFVAKADFSGYHHFSKTYEEHNQYAKEYQKKLDEYQANKKLKAD